jgi:DNA-binding XRE family transcriptional regulator
MALTIREWRRLREISQETMAQKLKIHVNTYQNWEKEPGKINWEKAVEIANILNISLDDISFETREVE